MSRSPSSRRALPRAARLLALFAAVAFSFACFSRSSGRFNVILVLVDTLRADHLSSYGYGRKTSPAIDSLAKDGVLFEECFSPVPWTPAATATLLTGLEPFTHGFTRPEKAPLSASAVTLAEVLRARGYLTAGFSGNLLIGKLSGFDQGAEGSFETVTWGEARKLNAQALPWLRENGPKGRFFLYLHYFDPHDPYDDPDGLWKSDAGLAPGASPGEEKCPKGDIEAVFQALREGKDPGLAPADLQRLLDRYDGEIRFVDAEIGKLLAEVKSLGLDDETLVVFTSDHGEQFLEHGGLKHGSSLHREELHVPLVFRVPGSKRAGERRTERVGLVDVFPTILGLLGVAPPGRLDGVDLFGTEPIDPERILFAETSHGWACFGGRSKEGQQLLAGRGRDRTVIVGPDDAEDYPRVYAGRSESENLAPAPPPGTGGFVDTIRRWRDATMARVLPNEPMSPEDYKALRAHLIQLGYIAAPKAPGETPPADATSTEEKPMSGEDGQ